MRPITFVRDGDCHICTSHSTKNGYPQIKVNNKAQYISRFIYEATKGAIPYGLVIRHTCNNPRCINPDHLIIGTHADNVMDRVESGNNAIGENNGRSKLTEDQVKFIRQNEMQVLNVDLAKKYDVSAKAIAQIKDGATWKHVTI